MGEELKNPVLKNRSTGQIVELVQSPFTIGRALGCDYVTENKVTSRKHCSLTKTEQGWTLTDLSTNGTLINHDIHIHTGEISAPLKHKDTFNIGEEWEFLTKTEPPEYLEGLRHDDSSPGSFDENGVSDEVLLNLADQVEEQLQKQPVEESTATNENLRNIDNKETNSTEPSSGTLKNDTTSKNSTVNPIIANEIVPSLNENKFHSYPSEQHDTLSNPINIPTTSKTALDDAALNGPQEMASTNNLILDNNLNIPTENQILEPGVNLVPKISNIATEAYISPENSNKKLKIIVTAPSSSNKNIVTAIIAPSTSTVKKTQSINNSVIVPNKVLQIKKLTPEQVKSLRETGKLRVVRPRNFSVNMNDLKNANVNCEISASRPVTSGSIEAAVGIPKTSAEVNINITDGVQTYSTANINPPSVIDITKIPIIISDSPITILKNNAAVHTSISHTPILINDSPVVCNKRKNKIVPLNSSNIPVVDLSSSISSMVDLSKSMDTSDPSMSEPVIINNIPIPVIPAPANEVVVETSNYRTDATDIPTGNKVHDCQEPGTSKGVNKDVKEQNQFEEMEDELLCTICANLFIKTVTLGCSHSFCQFCIETWKKKKSECPICRNKITSTTRTLVLDNVIEKMIESASDEMKEARKNSIEEREKALKEIEDKKKEAADQRNNAARGRGGRARRAAPIGRRGGNTNRSSRPIQRHASDSDHGNSNRQRDNNLPVVQAPAPSTFITITDSPSTTSDDSTEDEHSEGWSDEYNNDDWYNGRPGEYYGGYGSCFICGDRGHWANGCPYRS